LTKHLRLQQDAGGQVETGDVNDERREWTGKEDESTKWVMQYHFKTIQHKILDLIGGLKMEKMIRFFKDEEGATAVEYGLIAALIAVVIIAAVSLLGTNISGTFNTIATTVGGS